MNWILMCMITMSMLTPLLKHPMTMSLNVLLMAVVITLYSGILMKSFIYSYMLMIVMISGLLVLLIYMASVAPNKKFRPSLTLTATVMVMSSTIYLNLKSLDSNLTLISPSSTSLMTLFMKKNFMTITMITTLLIVMLITAIIVNIEEGPLRKSN